MMGAGAVEAQADLARRQRESLERTYGADGSKMANTKQQQAYFKAQAEARQAVLNEGATPSPAAPAPTLESNTPES
ncbi:hypothetical protein KC906_04275, partial [Candidatus Kaiserbacteria bacterium]|nr:hypothetical protein [Candidatus Kaiserbacteria bacterium]